MKMSKTAAFVVPACVLVLSLSACGGGGEDEGGISFRAADVSGGSAILATGGSPPDVSSAQSKSQQLAILYGANIGHWSTTTEVDWEGRVQRSAGGRRHIDCDPTTCDYGDTAFDPIMIRNGVRLARTTDKESLGEGGVTTTLGYGGWMEHSLFTVRLGIDTYDGGSFVNWVRAYSLALGDAPGTNPGAGALSWEGVMVGRNSDIDSASVSNVVQGDASVSAALSPAGAMSVDIAFSNIKDLNSGTSIADMNWTDLSVVGGSFGSGTIAGSFYGPGHEEVAGMFERNDILGAFGARR